MRDYCASIRKAKTNTTDNDKCWQGGGAMGTFIPY